MAEVQLVCEGCGAVDDSPEIQKAYAEACAGSLPPDCPECGGKRSAHVHCEGCEAFVSLDGVHENHSPEAGTTHTCDCGYDVPSGYLGKNYGATAWCHRCAED
jgi:hypothetical protein